jgi:hypothetical protein
MRTMPNLRPLLSTAALALLALAAACSGSSRSAPPDPQVGASVPTGAGGVAIAMVGTWEIRDAQIVETNNPTPTPPLNGTRVEIGPDAIVSIGGLSVTRANLELVLGATLETYVNQLNGKTLFYGLVVDQRATGGARQQVGVAGGAVSADAIAVEAFESVQGPGAASPIFTRSRYTLARVATTSPLWLEEPAVARDAAELLGAIRSFAAGR